MITKSAVAWCAECEHYLPADDIGTRCPSLDCTRTLRKRVGFICVDNACELQPLFRTRLDYQAHVATHEDDSA